MQPRFAAIEMPQQEEDLQEDGGVEIGEAYFPNHIIDVIPERIGNRTIISQLEGSAFGCGRVDVGRCEPPIKIPETIALRRGKSIVLIGPNGAGKTTIFDAITGMRSADFSGTTEKGAVVFGEPIHARKKLRISRLNQEEMLAGIGDVVVDDVLQQAERTFISELSGADTDAIDWSLDDAQERFDVALQNQEAVRRIEQLREQLVKLFRMDEFFDRRVEELSGGERTKLSLCMALMSEPDVLLLDEPTNHLDFESLTKLTALFEAYKRAGVSILSVSHVESYLEEAGTDGVIEIKIVDDSRQATASNKPYSSFIRDRSRPDFSVVEGRIDWQTKKSKEGGALVSPVVERITIDESPLVNIDLPSLLPQEVWVLSGNNGTGKTKLMEAMARKELGRGIIKREKGVSIAYMPQFWPDEVAGGTLADFFSWIKEMVDPNSDITSTNFTKAIREIGFKHREGGKVKNQNLLSKKLSMFSGGEQRILWFMAVSCFKSVDALFLDEPTNHLDLKLQEVVIRAIRDFPGAVVFSTHDVRLLQEISDDIGKKGGTMKPRNVVLNKNAGRTTISVSDQSPIEYIRARASAARKEAKRVKI